ncbi:MAG: hypothetical protein EA378_00650 [Phycisphaerales bacterium]|nr:MAG: hypothetical protein EA378_00650 [Phycisphaerales bacterium]
MSREGGAGPLARLMAWLPRRFGAESRDAGRARLGVTGERVAARRLRTLGYRVLQRNARPGGVEIDLVCEAPDRRTLVLVEVKARRPGPDGRPPEMGINAAKRQRLRRACEAVRRTRFAKGRPVRVDVVAIDAVGPRTRDWAFRHYIDALR